MAGQPKKLTREKFEEYVFAYLSEIYDKQTESKDTPTFYGLYLFINKSEKVSFHTVRRCFDEYWADIKEEFNNIRADLLSRGAMVGAYNPTAAIFALKNWCDWTDKQEQKIDMSAKVQRIEDYLAEYDD